MTVVRHRGLKVHSQQQVQKGKHRHNHQGKKMLLELKHLLLIHLVHRQVLKINL
jgi:hypothetical protein